MANPFEVRVPNALEALIAGEQGYSTVRGIVNEREQSVARREAQDFLSRGDTQNALARLIGAGDTKGAMTLAQYQNAANGVFGTPIYGTNTKGDPVLGAITKQGGWQEINTPGVRVDPGIKTIQTPQGTFVISGRSGAPMGGGVAPQGGPAPVQPGQAPQQTPGFYPADNRGKARDTKLGTEEGEIASKLPSSILQARQTVDLIDELLGEKPIKEGTRPDINQVFGPLDQYRPSWLMGSGGRNALARWEQLQGKAFGAAFDMLRGGGQITEVEGVKATNAYARLQRSQDEADAKAALKDFRDAVSEGARKLAERAGPSGAQYQSQVPGQAAAPVAPQPAAGQEPMQGAKQAPDGNWYVPDPNRPGKYLQVR